MALPSSGPLSLTDIQTEFGGSNPISLSEYYAGGANVPSGTSGTYGAVPSSGAISIRNFYGTAKSTRVTISYTFSGHTANASLNLSAISGYSAGQSDITVTINSGIYLYATSTGNYGLNISGGTTGDTLTIVNNGYIMGMGGAGGLLDVGESGGTALSLSYPATINNTNASAYIGGGGGGGGAACATTTNGNTSYAQGGGGAGGGAGGTNGFAGAGGGIGASGSNGLAGNAASAASGGGGGGRIFPGTGGSGSNNGGIGGGFGGGAGGGGSSYDVKTSSTGGAGGSANSSGGNGSAGGSGYAGGGGGGWGASGGSGSVGMTGVDYGTAGGAGGKAVALNGNTVTWVSGDTSRVYGAIS